MGIDSDPAAHGPRRDVARARAGDAEALGRLLERYRPSLEELAQRMLGRLKAKIESADVLQSTFVEALRNIHDFRGHTEVQFHHWVRRILTNNVRDKRKFFSAARRRHGRERPLRRSEADFGAQDLGPIHAAVDKEMLEQVRVAMRGLPDEHRRVLELRLDGLSHAAIAARLGRSEGSSRVLLARARAALALALGAGGLELEP